MSSSNVAVESVVAFLVTKKGTMTTGRKKLLEWKTHMPTFQQGCWTESFIYAPRSNHAGLPLIICIHIFFPFFTQNKKGFQKDAFLDATPR